MLHDEADLIERTLNSVFEKTKHDIFLDLYLTSGIFNERLLNVASEMHSRYGGRLNADFKNFPVNCVNSAIRKGYTEQMADMVFLGSPDYYFTKVGEFDSFINKASEYQDKKFCISSVREEGDGAVFQSFIYTKLGVDKIGYLDQNFIPSESVDSDHHKRCCLFYGESGNNIFENPYRKDIICSSEHHNHHFYKQGSSPPIRNYNRYLQNVFIYNRLNRLYFSLKWGQKNEYKYPFNNKKYSLKIDWDSVQNPYPEEFHNNIEPFF